MAQKKADVRERQKAFITADYSVTGAPQKRPAL